MRQKRSLLMGVVASVALAGSSSAQGRQWNVDVSTAVSRGAAKHLKVEDTLAAVLNNPVFAGFAPLILPWDNRSYDLSMPLHQMASLMPYHSEVQADVAIEALNQLIDEANAGQQIFYPLYDERSAVGGTSPESAGLFFFRGEAGAPFAIVSPGGGFSYVGSLHEGFPYAQAISEQGLNAFVLRYRPAQGGKVATEDLAAAISWVFRNAERLGVKRDGYSLWGSSAGARMTAAIGSHGVAAFGGRDVPGPSAVIMAYTSHSDVSRVEPDTFAIVGESDRIASPAAMRARVAALRTVGANVDYREYPGLGHGFGLGARTSAEGWIDDAIAFWRARTD